MRVKDILSAWLTEHGYDGLVNSNGQCGCRADDICPCSSEGIEYCEPAYMWNCANCPEHETCDNDWRDEGECFRLKKPETKT